MVLAGLFVLKISAMYPIILFPYEINDALNRKISKPIEPIRPVLPVIPTEPKDYNDGIIVLLAGLFLLIAGHNFPGLGLFVILIGVIWLVVKQQAINLSKAQYNKAKYEYYIVSTQLEKYPSECRGYEAVLAAYNDVGLADKHRKEEVGRILRKATPPKFLNEADIYRRPQRGISEKSFYPHLRTFLSQEYISEIAFLPIDYSTTKNGYYPDFAYINSKNNLYIDIEIDEPYSLIDKKPIHYKGVGHESADVKRNRYFLENGWVVIRFSEHQVINFPDECCKVVAETILKLISIHNPDYLSWIMSTTSHLPQYPSWTFEEARKMAECNSRDRN